MQSTLKTGLRIVGLAVMALAISHCGDNDNNDNDDGGGATRTPTPVLATRTPTPAVTDGTATPAPETPTPEETAGLACPSAISFEGNVNDAQLDPGWTGQSHGAGVIDKGKVTVSVVSCDSTSRPCGVCQLSGPIANPDAGAGTSNNHRCSNDTSIECTSDGDCTGGTCKFFFGAPLALSAGGVSTCVVNEVSGTITGTANIETGTSASNTTLISRVFTGPTADSPCPKCVGDPTPEDGQRGGTCQGTGAREGLSCDVGGTHKNAFFGSTSFDCPPLSGGQIAALPIKLLSSTGTVTTTLSADSPDCSGKAGAKCFCDTCNNINAEPCTSNADCPTSGGSPGVCGGRRCRLGANAGLPCTINTDCPGGACSRPGEPTRPNDCTDETCTPSASNPNNGECAGGPFEQFCGPTATFAGCSSDADCTQFAGNTCSIGKNRGCFLDNGTVGGAVTANGVADVPVNGMSEPTLASLFCIGPTSSGAVNAVAGIPGLGRLQLAGFANEVP